MGPDRDGGTRERGEGRGGKGLDEIIFGGQEGGKGGDKEREKRDEGIMQGRGNEEKIGKEGRQVGSRVEVRYDGRRMGGKENGG